MRASVAADAIVEAEEIIAGSSNPPLCGDWLRLHSSSPASLVKPKIVLFAVVSPLGMADNSPLTIKIYKQPVLTGGTQPHVLALSDGRDYLVKFKGNPQGTRALINEYVVNELIAKLEFEGGRGRVVVADAFFLSNEPHLSGRNLESGHQFATPYYEHHDNFTDAFLNRMENRDKLPQVIVLDTFVCNNDRGSGNLLMVFEDPTKQDCRFILIDHSVAFGGNTWNEGTLKSLRDSPQLFQNVVNLGHFPRDLAVFEPFLLRLEALTEDEIRAIIKSVPIDWGLHSADSEALLDFLVARKDKVRQILTSQLAL
jgi:hypothetical protein